MKYYLTLLALLALQAQSSEMDVVHVKTCTAYSHSNYGVLIEGFDSNSDHHLQAYLIEGRAKSVCPSILGETIAGEVSSGCTDKVKANYPACKSIKVLELSRT